MKLKIILFIIFLPTYLFSQNLENEKTKEINNEIEETEKWFFEDYVYSEDYAYLQNYYGNRALGKTKTPAKISKVDKKWDKYSDNREYSLTVTPSIVVFGAFKGFDSPYRAKFTVKKKRTLEEFNLKKEDILNSLANDLQNIKNEIFEAEEKKRKEKELKIFKLNQKEKILIFKDSLMKFLSKSELSYLDNEFKKYKQLYGYTYDTFKSIRLKIGKIDYDLLSEIITDYNEKFYNIDTSYHSEKDLNTNQFGVTKIKNLSIPFMPIEMYEKDKLVEFIYKSKLRYITNNPNDFDFNLYRTYNNLSNISITYRDEYKNIVSILKSIYKPELILETHQLSYKFVRLLSDPNKSTSAENFEIQTLFENYLGLTRFFSIEYDFYNSISKRIEFVSKMLQFKVDRIHQNLLSDLDKENYGFVLEEKQKIYLNESKILNILENEKEMYSSILSAIDYFSGEKSNGLYYNLERADFTAQSFIEFVNIYKFIINLQKIVFVNEKLRENKLNKFLKLVDKNLSDDEKKLFQLFVKDIEKTVGNMPKQFDKYNFQKILIIFFQKIDFDTKNQFPMEKLNNCLSLM